MRELYLIKSMGRTGSHIICEFLQRHGYDHCHIHFQGEFLDEISKKNFKKSKNLFVFCHCMNWLPDDPSQWNFIYSSRTNKFDQYCSFLIAHKTEQWTIYDKIKKIKKIEIDEVKARQCIIESNKWDSTIRSQIKNYKWKFSTEIVYENLVNNYNKLFDILTVNGTYNKEVKSNWQKSPYIFKDTIKNYKQFNKKFKELELC